MIKTQVIYNPIAGGGKYTNLPELVLHYLDTSKFDLNFNATAYAGHAELLAKEALASSYELIIIAGGDGSINEVAKTIVHQPIHLGIIPIGSGNGIARHLNIPLSPKKAIQRINTYRLMNMDAGLWNDRFFLGFAGIGFDGYIAQRFSTSKNRGFLNYAKLVLKEVTRFTPFPITIDPKKSTPIEASNAFICCIANTSQYGNDFKVSPRENASDGKLACIIVNRPSSTIGLFQLLLHSFLGKIDTNTHYHRFYFDDELTLHPSYLHAHIDGEPIKSEEVVVCKVVKDGVWVVV